MTDRTPSSYSIGAIFIASSREIPFSLLSWTSFAQTSGFGNPACWPEFDSAIGCLMLSRSRLLKVIASVAGPELRELLQSLLFSEFLPLSVLPSSPLGWNASILKRVISKPLLGLGANGKSRLP